MKDLHPDVFPVINEEIIIETTTEYFFLNEKLNSMNIDDVFLGKRRLNPFGKKTKFDDQTNN